jgi:hypothetical protein
LLIVMFVMIFRILVVFVVFAGLIMIFVRRLVVLEFDVLAEGRDVQSVLVGCVGFSFRDSLRGAYDFFD